MGGTTVINHDDAVRHGLEAAIFISELVTEKWQYTDGGSHGVIIDGEFWIKSSINHLSFLFPFWDKKYIRVLISIMVKKGVVKTKGVNGYPKAMLIKVNEEAL